MTKTNVKYLYEKRIRIVVLLIKTLSVSKEAAKFGQRLLLTMKIKWTFEKIVLDGTWCFDKYKNKF